MGLIPDGVIDEIRARADIVAVIGQHVQLRKAGRNHKGLCPFHQERTPSFNVSPDRGFFYCFGCQKKGDVFTFVMEYEGKSFVEAAESLAGRFGVDIPERSEAPGEQRRRSERAGMLDANRIAAEFFGAALADPRAGAVARAYLERRGVRPDTAQAFQLGCAPADWHALSDHLAARKVPAELAVAVGLIARQPRAGGFYDRFRDRLMCPVILPGGEIAGFSGRRLSEGEDAGAKYINSPESAVYKKSRLLFGLHAARDAIRQRRRAVLVEGNFDVISLHQAGLAETVAPLGTALTDDQAAALRRLSDEVVLLYDGDDAGRAATLKALKVLVAADVPVRIVSLPAGQDPDAMVASGRADELAALVDRAQPGIEYFIFEDWRHRARSADGRAGVLAEAAQVIGKVANPTKRDLITGTLAAAMDLDIGVVRAALRRAAKPDAGPPHAPASGAASGGPGDGRGGGPGLGSRRNPPPPPELELLAILADHPHLMQIAEENDVFSLLTDARLRDMYSAARSGSPMLSAVTEEFGPHIVKHVLAGAYTQLSDPARSLLDAACRLRQIRTREHLAQLQRQAQEATRRGDAERARQLFHEILTTRRQVD